MVDLALDPSLSVAVEPGGDGWRYRVVVEHDGVEVTRYGSNAPPWSDAGRLILRNIVAARIDGYDAKAEVGALVDAAFDAHREALATAFDGAERA